MYRKSVREELQRFNDVEIYNKRVFLESGGKKEYNFFRQMNDSELAINQTLHRYYVLTEETDYLTADHYIRDNFNVAVFKHNRYSFPYYHSHDFFEIVYVMGGSAYHQVDDVSFKMEQGDICLIAPDTKHSLSVFDESVVINILFRKKFIGAFLEDFSQQNNILSKFIRKYAYNPPNFKRDYILANSNNTLDFDQTILRMLIETEYEGELSNCILDALLIIFLSDIIHKSADNIKNMSVENNYSNCDSEAIDDILRYIHEHLTLISLDDIAEKFSFNKYYISRIIKKYTNQSFTNFVRTIRLSEVKRLLVNTTYSLSKISEIVGYSDSSNLVKAFKKEWGMTPKEFRKMFVDIKIDVAEE